jgi:hypothetical protein
MNPLTMAGGAIANDGKNNTMNGLFMVFVWIAVGLTIILIMIVRAISQELCRGKDSISVNPYVHLGNR